MLQCSSLSGYLRLLDVRFKWGELEFWLTESRSRYLHKGCELTVPAPGKVHKPQAGDLGTSLEAVLSCLLAVPTRGKDTEEKIMVLFFYY